MSINPATRRVIARIAVAVCVICLLLLAGLSAARHSWSPLAGAGWPIAGILGALVCLRSTRGRS